MRIIAGFFCLALAFCPPALGGLLSLGKPYSIAPEPSYKHCTDEGDAVQLTDGQSFKPGAEHQTMWMWKGAVGWHISPYVMIVIDLQKRCRIDKVSCHTTGGGHAGVYYPARSDFFVSENGVDYTFVKRITPADDKIVESPIHNELHTFVADEIGRTGRYVMLALWRDQGGYLFTDEVSVYGEVLPEPPGPPAPPGQGEVLPPDDATVDVANHYLTRVTRTADSGAPVVSLIVNRATHMRCNLRRVQAAAARALARGPQMTPTKKAAYDVLQAQIKVLGKSIGRDPGEAQWRTFVATTLAMYGRAKALPFTGEGYIVWGREPWDPLQPHDMPESGAPRLETIRVRAVGNEYESACITVSNVSDIPLELRVEPPMLFKDAGGETALPTGPYVDEILGPHGAHQIAGGPRGWVTLKQVAFSETKAGMLGDALTDLGDAGLFIVPPASTGQLWLTISTRDVPAGRYTATVRMKPVRTAVFRQSRVNVKLEVLKTRLTGAPPIRSCGWSYPRFTEIVRHDRAAVEDQIDHYMDSFVVEIWLCGTGGVYDPDADVTGPMNFEKLDRYLDLYERGRLLLIYTSGPPGMSVKGRAEQLALGDDGWDAAFKSWYRQIVRHLLLRGLTYDDFAFYPIDEPQSAERSAKYLHMVRLAKQVAPEAQTFVTAPDMPIDVLRSWAPFTDIFCLGGPESFDKAPILIRQGRKAWYYDGAASKAHHPIGVARRDFWRAFRVGLEGLGVWAYACSGWQKTGEETAWTERDNIGRGDASMIYRGKHGPVTSKRWEAWRDGVEDYWLLTLLDKAHREDQTTVNPRSLAAKATALPKKKGSGTDPLDMAFHAGEDSQDAKRILAAREKLMDAIAELE